MPLTAEDVRAKRFTTVRLREGYDMGEVDQFLDEVEAELRRLGGEGDELRSKLQALTGEPAPASAGSDTSGSSSSSTSGTSTTSGTAGDARGSGTGEAGTVEPDTVALGTDDRAPLSGGSSSAPSAAAVAEGPAATAPTASAAVPVERLEVTTTAEASAAATRLLELAGRSADQLVSEAELKAEEIVEEARGQAEALESATTERRRTLFADIDQEKARLDNEIEGLRTFEREYRAELRTYFEEQLAALEGHGAGGMLARSETLGDPDDDTASAGTPATAPEQQSDSDNRNSSNNPNSSDSTENSDSTGNPDNPHGSPLQSVLREDGS